MKTNSQFSQREGVSGCGMKRFASTSKKKNIELENFQSFPFGINEEGFLLE